MISRIEQDHSRFREIIRGKVRQNLRKYMARGDIIAPQGKGSVTILMPQINIPRFTFGDNSGGGVGQGEGQPGDPVDGAQQPGQGKGKAGEGEGDKALEIEVSLDELAEILGEELGLPRIQPKGVHALGHAKTATSACARRGRRASARSRRRTSGRCGGRSRWAPTTRGGR